MYQALYRKYRPATFDEVVGQKVIIRTLSNSILNKKLSHAYLFTGPRGTGKTSIAKIFSKIVNCENLNGIQPCNKCVNCTQNIDVIEIDAASNNGVDEIRELRDKVNLVPSIGKYKIYIIDEVHMLTTAAFNALLKTLEEPPKHIIFILATTEPYKIPMTILSRCQRYDFKKISVSEIKKGLLKICDMENIEIEDEALDLIAYLSDGGMRDSIGLIDQLTSYTNKKINCNDVHDVYGTITTKKLSVLIEKICTGKIKDIYRLINEYDNDGKNLVKINELMIEFLKNVLIFSNNSTYFENDLNKKFYCSISNLINENEVYEYINILMENLNLYKNTLNTKLVFEISIIKMLSIDSKNKDQISNQHIKFEDDVLTIKPKDLTKKEHETKKIDDELKSELEKLKEIRINNGLCEFNKTNTLLFKKKLEGISNLLMIPEYSSIVSLILDGELKAKSNKNLIFVYKIDKLDEYFNCSLKKVEQVLKEFFKEELLPIAVTNKEWNRIKLEFNKNLKENNNIYIRMEEKDIKLSIEDTSIKHNNEIENIFESQIVYK